MVRHYDTFRRSIMLRLGDADSVQCVGNTFVDRLLVECNES
jgi:hypothetical protein